MSTFGLWPGHWGLKGKTRERAKAEFELSGYELEVALAKIDAANNGDFNMQLLEIDLEHGKITTAEYKRSYAENFLEGTEQERELLELDHDENKLSDNEYEKQLATLKGESWVTIVSIKPNSDKPNHGELEVDWNELFVTELKDAGYEAAADEQVVDLWLADLCRNIAMEQFSGTGDFDEKVADQFIKKSPKSEDGKWEAS